VIANSIYYPDSFWDSFTEIVDAISDLGTAIFQWEETFYCHEIYHCAGYRRQGRIDLNIMGRSVFYRRVVCVGRKARSYLSRKFLCVELYVGKRRDDAGGAL
jgi:hypothetical protein